MSSPRDGRRSLSWMAGQAWQSLFRHGPLHVARRILRRMLEPWEYELRRRRTDPTPSELARQRDACRHLPPGPTISIIIRVDAVGARRLDETLDSLDNQTRKDWDAVLVPESDPVRDVAWRCASEHGDDVRIVPTDAPLTAASALRLCRGAYVMVLDAGDRLAPDTVFRIAETCAATPRPAVVTFDEDERSPSGRRRRPVFKPGWSPELLLSRPYAGSGFCIARQFALQAAEDADAPDSAFRYACSLRADETPWPKPHLARALLHKAPPSARPSANRPGEANVLRTALARRRQEAVVETDDDGRIRRTRFLLRDRPPVSVVIATKNRAGLLERCVRSLRKRTAYAPLRFVIVDNGSDEADARALLERLESDDAVVLRRPGAFNHSALCNAGAEVAADGLLLFLNNDVEAREPGWLDAMAEHATRKDVGATGAKLIYPDGRVQHGGIAVGLFGAAGNCYRGAPPGDPGRDDDLRHVRNTAAVTGACLLIRTGVFRDAGGFDEAAFPASFNDVDLCLKLVEAGLRNVWTPHAELVHHEGVSRGRRPPDEQRATACFRERWKRYIDADPWFNPAFDRWTDRMRLDW